MRDYFLSKGIHDYNEQRKGNKQRVRAYFLTATEAIDTVASLYRPVTKKGDPRIWFDGLKRFTLGNEALCIVVQDKELFVLRAADSALWASADRVGSPLHELIRRSRNVGGAIANELLQLIRERASMPLQSFGVGDKSVGWTLENALGLPPNSSRVPDYKGIEIKAGRNTGTRQTLFAQVPDWTISTLKSSGAIAHTYGYFRNGMQRLNCSLAADKINSQGLYLWIDAPDDLLRERHATRAGSSNPSLSRSYQEVVAWRLAEVKKSLLEKHHETFWVSATSTGSGIDRVFTYSNILHTKAPLAGAFATLLGLGTVTVDHLIKCPPGRAAKERGPLFKIRKTDFRLLFPPPDKYRIRP